MTKNEEQLSVEEYYQPTDPEVLKKINREVVSRIETLLAILDLNGEWYVDYQFHQLNSDRYEIAPYLDKLVLVIRESATNIYNAIQAIPVEGE